MTTRQYRQVVPLEEREPPRKTFWATIRKRNQEGTTPSTPVTNVSRFRLPKQRIEDAEAAKVRMARERRYKYVVPEKARGTKEEFSYYATKTLPPSHRALCGVILCRAPLEFDDVLFCTACKPKVEEYLQGMLDLLKYPPLEQVNPTEYLLPYFGVNIVGGSTMVVAKSHLGGGTGGTSYQSSWRAPAPRVVGRGDPIRRARVPKECNRFGIPIDAPAANRERDQRTGGGVGTGTGVLHGTVPRGTEEDPAAPGVVETTPDGLRDPGLLE